VSAVGKKPNVTIDQADCSQSPRNNQMIKKMAGLARICKMYGSIEVSDANGKKVTWLWDYVNDKPRLKTEMTKEEIMASEKAKWMGVKSQLDAKFKALEWWNSHTDKEKLELSLKHYDVLDLNTEQIIFVWRRLTGGEQVS
jgi:hypothetical protein